MKKAYLPTALVLISLTIPTTTFAVLKLDATGSANSSPKATATDTNGEQRMYTLATLATTDANQSTISAKLTQLRAKLAKFKDQRKAERVEKVSDLLVKINENRVKIFNNHLDKMNQLIAKVELRSQNLPANQKESTKEATLSAKASIQRAKDAITLAKDAVATQSAKDYTVVITTEAATKKDVKAKRDSLYDDLKKVLNLVINAKQEIANAIKAVAQSK